MFVFEDITMLLPEGTLRLYEKCGLEDFAIAIKQTVPALLDHLTLALGKEEIEQVIKRSAELGPLRVRDVDAAKQKIIEALRAMEEAGEVLIARPGELIE